MISVFHKNCPMCKDSVKGGAWSRLILANAKSTIECANYFNMSPEEVNNHIYNHYTDLVDGDPSTQDYVVKKILRMSSIVEIMADHVIATIDSGNVDISKVERVMKMFESVQSMVIKRGEIAGIIKPMKIAGTQIQINTVKNKFESFTNVVMLQLCPKCRKVAAAEMQKFIDDDSDQNLLITAGN